MAPKTTSTDASAPAAPKKPRAPQKRVLHIFYKSAPDANGELAVQIVKVMSDARKVVDYLDSPEFQGQGIKRYKHEIVADAKGDLTDGAEVQQDSAAA